MKKKNHCEKNIPSLSWSKVEVILSLTRGSKYNLKRNTFRNQEAFIGGIDEEEE